MLPLQECLVLGLVLSIRCTSVAAQTPEFIGELLLQPQINNQKCLTATNNTDGAPVVLTSCSESENQRWVFVNGTVRIFGDKCLDVTEGVNADGTRVQLYSCTPPNTPNQQWNYNKWVNILEWTNFGKCLNVVEGGQADGTPVQIWGCNATDPNQVWSTGYSINRLPDKSQAGQTGTNNCGPDSRQDANCQTAWFNSASDFCLWGPPYPAPIGNIEREAVAWCTKSGRGTRLIPDGTLTGVHFVQTPEYIQITGTGNFTNLGIPQGDAGGELDNRGMDGKGNPIGGLLYGNTFGLNLQYHEWTEFIGDREFCFRACIGPRSKQLCNHVYDVMGCWWNMPANYAPGVFEECLGDPAQPMGVYGTYTWSQGVSPTPSAHPAPASSSCTTLATVSVTPARRSVAGRREVADPVPAARAAIPDPPAATLV